jgi:hypothetical protein
MFIPDLDFFYPGSRSQKSAGSRILISNTFYSSMDPTLSTVLRNPAFETYVGHVYIDAECLEEVQR